MRNRLILTVVLTLLLGSACGRGSGGQTAAQTPTAAAPVATPTPMSRALTVCLGEEPNTLYPYGGPNGAARSVLSAVLDGAIDAIKYEYEPVILTQLPSLENGDAQIVPVSVAPGEHVVNAAGDLVALEAGTSVRPAGCRTDECTVNYDGVSPLQMDQMVVTFRLRPDLTWSDGTPLNAEDSVYAFQLASDPASVTSTYLIDRTRTYEAADASTVQWWSVPGFLDPTYFTNFWAPAPRHMWSQFTASQLATVDLASRSPLGWGPYAVREWAPGDHITLEKNQHYFRRAEGLPRFDTLTFRFTPDVNVAISELVAGRCDVLDPSVRLDGQVGLLLELEAGDQLQTSITPGMTIEWLAYGIVPAAYDDGYDTLIARDRQDIFADPRTRQGIALCLDRQKVVDTVLFGQTSVPASFVPPEHPVFAEGLPAYSYDPAAGLALLEQAGWRDTDGDPLTPLSAVSVSKVAAGTPLQLTYYTTTAVQRRQVADILAQSLTRCEVGFSAQFLTQNDLYTSGPAGVLFGRRFDLIEYAMGVNGVQPPCEWFTTDAIPTAANRWIGTNVTGFSAAAFDSACGAARNALPDEPGYSESYRLAQSLFADALPAVPLYFRLRVAAGRPDLCNFNLDPSGSAVWNVENYDIAEVCPS